MKQILSGALFVVISIFFLIYGSGLEFGQISQPGTGFMPTIVSAALFLLGLIVIFRKLK